MAKRNDIPTRNEVAERIEKDRKEMEGKEVNLDKIASDVETVRKTLENLEFKGTADGSEHVEKHVKSAEDVTTEAFGKEDEKLEQIQKDNEDFQGELQDHHGSSESDLKKISDASSSIETKETNKKLQDAKEAAFRETEFLAGQIDRAREARDKSNAVQEQLKSRVISNKGG